MVPTTNSTQPLRLHALRVPAFPPGRPVSWRPDDLAALLAEDGRELVWTLVGYQWVARSRGGPVYSVGAVGGLTASQACHLLLMVGAVLPEA